jgi:DNA-binding transcriptional LysR family regulator
MATRIPPVHALSAFEAAARHGSFALAAEELCITPSALSHRIRLLEEFVGERLFMRDGRNVSLSEFGRRYLDVVRQALRTLTDFPMPRRAASVQPRVKLTVPPTFARYLLVPQLASFTKLHPEIAIEIYLSVPLYDLSLAESDIEVRFGPGRYPNLQSEKLFHESTFAVVSPKYLAEIGEIRTPADLQKATLIRSALEPWQPWFEAAGLDWPEPSTGIRVDDLGLLLEMVKYGHGVGLTRQQFGREMLESGDVVRLFNEQTGTPPHGYHVVYEKAVLERPEVVSFLKWLQLTFGHVESPG